MMDILGRSSSCWSACLACQSYMSLSSAATDSTTLPAKVFGDTRRNKETTPPETTIDACKRPQIGLACLAICYPDGF